MRTEQERAAQRKQERRINDIQQLLELFNVTPIVVFEVYGIDLEDKPTSILVRAKPKGRMVDITPRVKRLVGESHLVDYKHAWIALSGEDPAAAMDYLLSGLQAAIGEKPVLTKEVMPFVKRKSGK